MGHYTESHEGGRAFVGDGMEAKRSADVPMGAMWTQQPGVDEELHGANADIRESASVAHLYGQNLVAAESMTAASNPWAWSPATLKPTADKLLAMGLNRFVIHTSVHQPLLDKVPGLSLGPFGQWFTRQRDVGRAGARVGELPRAVLVPPAAGPLRRRRPLLLRGGHEPDGALRPPGPARAARLQLRLRERGRRCCTCSGWTPAGWSRRAACGTACWRSTRTRGDVAAGAAPNPRTWSRPARSSSVRSPPAVRASADDDAEVRAIADELWGRGRGRAPPRRAGAVYGDVALGEVLARIDVAPDFEHTKPRPDSNVLFVHRALADGDLYFVDNRTARAEDVEATFRVSGRQPGAVARGHRLARAHVVPRRRRAHRRAAPPRAVGHGVRRVPAGSATAASRTGVGDRRGPTWRP